MAALAAGKKPPVRVTINGHTYRSTVATIDGQPMVGVSAENRALAGVSGGDEVDVDIELDTAPRVVEVPAELAAALAGDAAAKQFFDLLVKQPEELVHTAGVRRQDRRNAAAAGGEVGADAA